MLTVLFIRLCFGLGVMLSRPPVEMVHSTAFLQSDSLQSMISSQYELADLVARRQQSGAPFLKFLDQPTIKMFLYHLPRNGEDRQTPHRYDEVYYVANGRAELTAGKDTYSVRPGSVVFVKAEVEHRFHHITEDLDVIVFFSIQPDKK